MIAEVAKLSREEKLNLADELLEDVYGSDDRPEFDEVVGKLLEARVEHYRKNPETAMSWAEFRRKWGREE